MTTDFGDVLEAGRTLDLSGCVYGEWRDDFVATPHGYYYFLAGLTLTRSFSRIVEIGTHYGGAITAMSRAVVNSRSGDVRLVTVDVTNLNADALAEVPHLRRVQGDSLDRRVVESVCAHFDGPIDLLYVDSRHEHRETLENIAVYANRLHPKVIVVDDINLNEQMRELWQAIIRFDPGTTTDVSRLVDRKSAGFGVIECREGFRWPELRGPNRAGWHLYRRVRRAVGPHLPRRVRQLLRSSRSWRSRG